MAIVDAASDASGEYLELLDDLAAQNGVLSIVCGNDADAEEEILVRQKGAWLYLPGVEEGSNVSLLCSEARHVVERMHSVNTTPRPALRRAQ